MKYAFIREHQQRYTVKRMRKVLSVSSSGYYDWVARPESERSKSNRALTTKIRFTKLAEEHMAHHASTETSKKLVRL